jgi:3-phosphoshikimate 1-carboxyvinyltransferase
MTLQILNKLGIFSSFGKNIITVFPAREIKKQDCIIESDWSSASYHYSLCALGNGLKITLKYLFKNSLQADRRIADIYQDYFGIQSTFQNNEVILSKNENFIPPDFIKLDMNDCPDIAQTIAVTAFGLRIPITITGLETLKIKETDRLQALKNEIEKCGGKVEITTNTLELKSFEKFVIGQTIQTYNDHRMAMSFAPLQLLFPLIIEKPEVVEKSYTEFWTDMMLYGIEI